MRKDKHIAINMRKSGKSYAQIRASLNIPVSTLSNWFADVEWSKKLRDHLSASVQRDHTVRLVKLNKIRGNNLKRIYAEARDEARREFALLKYDPLFVSGVMLYWGEGAKSPKQGVKFTNSDPRMIEFYIKFLTNSCRIPLEMIRAYVLIYPEIEEKTARAYWSKMIGLPWENFTKCVRIEGRHATRRLGWGVCTVTISSTYFKQKMLEWISVLPQELLRREYYENISL